jgi:hypothetical protein
VDTRIEPLVRLFEGPQGRGEIQGRAAAVACRVKRHLEDLRQMESAAARGLGNLLAAAEPIRYQQRVGGGLPNCGQQASLTDLHREFVMFAALEAEGSG